jgi:hypothetical protein
MNHLAEYDIHIETSDHCDRKITSRLEMLCLQSGIYYESDLKDGSSLQIYPGIIYPGIAYFQLINNRALNPIMDGCYYLFYILKILSKKACTAPQFRFNTK